MTTAFLYFFTSPSSSQERSHIAPDHGHPNRDLFPASISKPTARKAGGKQPTPKRPPQRGLGIAQLERLRIQESRMKLTDGEFQLPTYTASTNVYVDGRRWNDLKTPRHGIGVAPLDHPRPPESFNQITDGIPSYTNVGGCGWHDLPPGSVPYGYQRWRTLNHTTPCMPAPAIRSEFLDYCAVDRDLMTGGNTRFCAACPPILEPPSNQMPQVGNCEFLALVSPHPAIPQVHRFTFLFPFSRRFLSFSILISFLRRSGVSPVVKSSTPPTPATSISPFERKREYRTTCSSRPSSDQLESRRSLIRRLMLRRHPHPLQILWTYLSNSADVE